MWLLLLGAGAYAQQPTADNTATGTLTVYYGNGDTPCTYPATSNTLHFVKEMVTGGFCKELNGGDSLQLRDFPSATKLFLLHGRPHKGQLPSSPRLCGLNSISAYEWRELRTIKHLTNTEQIAIGDITTIPANQVIVPGLLFVEHKILDTPDHLDGIDCIII